MFATQVIAGAAVWRRLRIAFVLLAPVVGTGCLRTRVPQASVITDVRTEPVDGLRTIGAIALVIPGSNGTSTPVGISGTGIATGQPTSAIDLTRRAGDLLRFELQRVGFRMTADTASADAIAELTMGRVRFDSQIGWTAQDAVLTFRRSNQSLPIAAFQTTARLTMPGADTLVKALRRIVQTKY
jgi:hypothetical protein